MAETALAAFGILHPLFIACREIIQNYRLTQSFGADYDRAKRKLEIQVGWFEALSQRSRKFIANSEAIDPFDENNKTTQAIVNQVVLLRECFAEIDKLIKKNERRVSAVSETSGTSSASGDVMSSSFGSPFGGSKSGGLNCDAFPVVAAVTTPGSGSGSESGRKVTEFDLNGPSSAKSESSSKKSWSWSVKPFRTKNRSKQELVVKPGVGFNGKERNRVETLRTPSPSSSSTMAISPPANTSIVVSGAHRQLERPQHLSLLSPGSDYFDVLVHDTKEQFSENSKIYQSSTPLYNRVHWAASDQEAFFKKLGEIEQGNAMLERLLSYNSPDVLAGLPPSEGHFSDLGLVQSAFERLHAALASANGRTKKDSLEISIKIDENVSEFTEQICRGEEDLLGDISHESNVVLLLRAHGADEDPETAVEFLAHSRAGTEQFTLSQDINPEEKIKSLKQALTCKTQSEDDDYGDSYYVPVGFACRVGTSQVVDPHRLFRNEYDKWRHKHTLHSILQTPGLDGKISPMQKIQFAKIIVRGQLNLANVRHECSDPRPQRIVFYSLCEQENAPGGGEDGDHEPAFIGPYFKVGFGSKPPRVRYGTTSGATQQRPSTVVEIGLLLFQISTCLTIAYGNDSEGFRRAKEDALTRIHEVDRTLGPGFAELCQICLLWDDENKSGNRVDMRETIMLKKLYENLRKLERMVEKTPDLSYLLR